MATIYSFLVFNFIIICETWVMCRVTWDNTSLKNKEKPVLFNVMFMSILFIFNIYNALSLMQRVKNYENNMKCEISWKRFTYSSESVTLSSLNSNNIIFIKLVCVWYHKTEHPTLKAIGTRRSVDDIAFISSLTSHTIFKYKVHIIKMILYCYEDGSSEGVKWNSEIPSFFPSIIL